MKNKKTFLAIIPARGGSKRLPHKNILPLAGKPMINWTIEAGLNSKYLDRVVVSSDNEEILILAQQAGAQIISRPAELAQDNSTSFDVIKHVQSVSEYYDYIVLLQPTSPLRTSQHIDEAIDVLESKKADAVISVSPLEHSLHWANVLPESDSMIGFLDENVINMRSQDLEHYFCLNGAIYICKTRKLLDNGSFFLKENIYAYKMDRFSSVDIDTLMDFKIAEALMAE